MGTGPGTTTAGTPPTRCIDAPAAVRYCVEDSSSPPPSGSSTRVCAAALPAVRRPTDSARSLSVSAAAKSSAAPAVPWLVTRTTGQLIVAAGEVPLKGSCSPEVSRMTRVLASVNNAAAAIPVLNEPTAVLRKSMSRRSAPCCLRSSAVDSIALVVVSSNSAIRS